MHFFQQVAVSEWEPSRSVSPQETFDLKIELDRYGLVAYLLECWPSGARSP